MFTVDSNYPSHYLGSAKTMRRMGHAFGETILKLHRDKKQETSGRKAAAPF